MSKSIKISINFLNRKSHILVTSIVTILKYKTYSRTRYMFVYFPIVINLSFFARDHFGAEF